MPGPAETRIIGHFTPIILIIVLSGAFMSAASHKAYGCCPHVSDVSLPRTLTVIKTPNGKNPRPRSTTNDFDWIPIADDRINLSSVSGSQIDRRLPFSYRRKQRHYQFEYDLERSARPHPRWSVKKRSQRCQGDKQGAACPKTSAAISGVAGSLV
jgi:hypothetical protein